MSVKFQATSIIHSSENSIEFSVTFFSCLSVMKGSLNEFYNEVGVIYLPKRKNYIFDVMEKMNISITMPQPAILGVNLDRDDLVRRGILHPHSKLHINEVACALSHFTLIKKFLDSSLHDSIMIFEDDIRYQSNYYDKIKSLLIPDDVEITQYGHCWDICSTKEQIGKTDVYITENPLCCHSYAINKRGAKKVLKYAFPILLPIDVFYVSLTKNGNMPTYFNTITKYYYNYRNNKDIENLVIYTIYPRVFSQLKGTENSDKLLDIQISNLGNNDPCLECYEDIIEPEKLDRKTYRIVCILLALLLFLAIWILKTLSVK